MSVVLPTALAAIYFGLIASDVYVSESRFIIRSSKSKETSGGGLSAILKESGFSPSQDDADVVQDYMISRDALRQLDMELGLAKSFSSPTVDRFSRFGGLDWDTSFEALYRYYQRRVKIIIDKTSPISTLQVRAFSAAESRNINEMLLEMGERLINQLNVRARQDMISFAAQEVANAEAKARNAALDLASYRTRKGVFDPKHQSGLQLQQVSKQQDDLILAKAQYAQILCVTPNNPQVPVIKKRIETLQAEMAAETAKVVDSADGSLTKKAVEYERLELDQTFADKQLAAALTSLQQARNEALRKQLYLERIVQPNEPDIAIEPYRLRIVFGTFLVGLITWGVLSLLISGVREHHG